MEVGAQRRTWKSSYDSPGFPALPFPSPSPNLSPSPSVHIPTFLSTPSPALNPSCSVHVCTPHPSPCTPHTLSISSNTSLPPSCILTLLPLSSAPCPGALPPRALPHTSVYFHIPLCMAPSLPSFLLCPSGALLALPALLRAASPITVCCPSSSLRALSRSPLHTSLSLSQLPQSL